MNSFEINKRKAKFNIVDMVIIVAVIGIIAASFIRGDIVRRFTETDNATVVYTFEARNLKSTSALYIEEGDKLYVKDSGKYIGTITGFTVKNALTVVETADGKLIEGTLPDRIDLIVTAETSGRKTDAGVFINGGLFISAGKEFEITTDKLTYPMSIENVYISETDTSS
ncbi:MAG: DUF4330 family protein [Eubacteriales bacterium]|nr:DUF4330 family protein [Eubacteriales bacterium]MDD4474173.1 DUF4330 family protein [Eubacteriales bacterium]